MRLLSSKIVFLLGILSTSCSIVFAQHKDMTLTFNEEGKLLGGYLPRYNPDLCRIECKNDYSLTIRVLLPVDYLADDDKEIRKKAGDIDKAINDSTSTLYRILRCHQPAKLKALQDSVMKDSIGWRFDSVYNLIIKGGIAAWKQASVYKVIKDSSISQRLDSVYKKIMDSLKILKFDSIYKVFKDSIVIRKYGEDRKTPVDTTVTWEFITEYTIVKTEIDKWNMNYLPDIFPEKLQGYLRFIKALTDRDTATLQRSKEFVPFRLKVKGIQLDTTCLRFSIVDNKKDLCDCIKGNKRYVALEFGIPPAFITKDVTVDSFQLQRTFPMKTVAIGWYNKMLEDYRKDILKLKLLQESVRTRLDTVSNLLLAIDTLNAIEKYCKNPGELQTMREKMSTKICLYKDTLRARFGEFNCKDSCNGNILLCLPVLAEWVLKLIWLNGEYVRLNPFNFTTSKSIVVKTNLGKNEISKKNTDKRNALIQLDFWDTAISHLRDSVMRAKGIDIDSNNALLKRLLLLRDSALTAIEKNTADPPKDEAAENADKLRKFITVTQTNYKGWLVPYKSSEKNDAYKPDKMWLRNYYLDQVPNPLRNKLHFTYPEDENVTLLLHNIPAGTLMEVTESVKPFADSATFTVMAGEAVATAASLYASLGPVAPIVKNLLKITNIKKTNEPVSVIATTQDGQQISNFIFNTTQQFIDTLRGLSNFIKEKSPLKINVEGSYSGKTIFIDIIKNINQITKSANSATVKINQQNTKDSPERDCMITDDTCYLNYLKSLLLLATAPDFIDEDLKARTDTTPIYYSGRYQLSDQEAAYKMEYKLRAVTKKAGEADRIITVDTSYIKVGKFRSFQLAAGIAYTPNAGFITSVDTSGGGFKIGRDEDKFRFIGGIRWYPRGLYNQKDPTSIFRDQRWVHRLSVLVAVSVPKPLENIYLGGGVDIVPGLNFSAGLHLQQRNRYTISNNRVESRSIGYRGHAFYSLTVDPGLLVNAITSLF